MEERKEFASNIAHTFSPKLLVQLYDQSMKKLIKNKINTKTLVIKLNIILNSFKADAIFAATAHLC